MKYQITLNEKDPEVVIRLEGQRGMLWVNREPICPLDATDQEKLTKALLENTYVINLDEEENKILKELLENNQISDYWGHQETEIKTIKEIIEEQKNE